jgi:hypothetical protein
MASQVARRPHHLVALPNQPPAVLGRRHLAVFQHTVEVEVVGLENTRAPFSSFMSMPPSPNVDAVKCIVSLALLRRQS